MTSLISTHAHTYIYLDYVFWRACVRVFFFCNFSFGNLSLSTAINRVLRFRLNILVVTLEGGGGIEVVVGF